MRGGTVEKLNELIATLTDRRGLGWRRGVVVVAAPIAVATDPNLAGPVESVANRKSLSPEGLER